MFHRRSFVTVQATVQDAAYLFEGIEQRPVYRRDTRAQKIVQKTSRAGFEDALLFLKYPMPVREKDRESSLPVPSLQESSFEDIL